MDDDHAVSPEADTKQFLVRTERQAAWFPVVALGFLGLLYVGAKWRAEDPLVYLVLGCGMMLALLGAELLRTKALILRIEYLRMRSL